MRSGWSAATRNASAPLAASFTRNPVLHRMSPVSSRNFSSSSTTRIVGDTSSDIGDTPGGLPRPRVVS